MSIGKGFPTIFLYKKNTGTWGSGAPLLGIAGDGIEVIRESLVPASSLIDNEGISGSAQQLPGVKGNELHAGDFEADFLYQGVEVPLAQSMGTAVAPVQQGG